MDLMILTALVGIVVSQSNTSTKIDRASRNYRYYDLRKLERVTSIGGEVKRIQIYLKDKNDLLYLDSSGFRFKSSKMSGIWDNVTKDKSVQQITNKSRLKVEDFHQLTRSLTVLHYRNTHCLFGRHSNDRYRSYIQWLTGNCTSKGKQDGSLNTAKFGRIISLAARGSNKEKFYVLENEMRIRLVDILKASVKTLKFESLLTRTPEKFKVFYYYTGNKSSLRLNTRIRVEQGLDVEIQNGVLSFVNRANSKTYIYCEQGTLQLSGVKNNSCDVVSVTSLLVLPENELAIGWNGAIYYMRVTAMTYCETDNLSETGVINQQRIKVQDDTSFSLDPGIYTYIYTVDNNCVRVLKAVDSREPNVCEESFMVLLANGTSSMNVTITRRISVEVSEGQFYFINESSRNCSKKFTVTREGCLTVKMEEGMYDGISYDPRYPLQNGAYFYQVIDHMTCNKSLILTAVNGASNYTDCELKLVKTTSTRVKYELAESHYVILNTGMTYFVEASTLSCIAVKVMNMADNDAEPKSEADFTRNQVILTVVLLVVIPVAILILCTIINKLFQKLKLNYMYTKAMPQVEMQRGIRIKKRREGDELAVRQIQMTPQFTPRIPLSSLPYTAATVTTKTGSVETQNNSVTHSARTASPGVSQDLKPMHSTVKQMAVTKPRLDAEEYEYAPPLPPKRY